MCQKVTLPYASVPRLDKNDYPDIAAFYLKERFLLLFF